MMFRRHFPIHNTQKNRLPCIYDGRWVDLQLQAKTCLYARQIQPTRIKPRKSFITRVHGADHPAKAEPDSEHK